MSSTKLRGSRLAIGKIACLLVWGLGLALTAKGQSGQTPASKQLLDPPISEAIAKVQSGTFGVFHLQQIGQADAVEAIPDLEKQFVVTQEPMLKAKIAQVLVKLGDKDNTYWDYLARNAAPALESDAPNPIGYDSQGKEVPGPSSEFKTWAASHNRSVADDGMNAIYVYPGAILLLGESGDPRAVPLLRRGLSSPNNMIQIAAAAALAEMQDNDSVPLIIDSLKRAPAQMARQYARNLAYFNNAQAQDEANKYLTKDEAQHIRNSKAAGHSALH